MKVIGITGPTGAGKTTALKVLSALGVAVADADEVYHALLTENEEMRAGLVSAFGENILDERGKIDRKKLSQAVYPDRLEELNAITHPYVVERMGQLLSLAEEEGKSIFAIDAIALMESGLSRWCDETVAVLAPKELRLRRIMVRDNIDEAYARRRVDHQKPEEFYREGCSWVLENRAGDTPEEFEGRAEALFRDLLLGSC